MATLVIRNLDPTLHTSLKARAAAEGRSMEEEARRLLRDGLAAEPALRDQLGRCDPRPFRAARRIELPDDPARTGSRPARLLRPRMGRLRPA